MQVLGAALSVLFTDAQQTPAIPGHSRETGSATIRGSIPRLHLLTYIGEHQPEVAKQTACLIGVNPRSPIVRNLTGFGGLFGLKIWQVARACD